MYRAVGNWRQSFAVGNFNLRSTALFLRFNMDEPSAKMAHQVQRLGTHDGTFHCDEAFACYMLKSLPLYKHADIVRTRDPEQLKMCNVVVDVGGVFSHEQKRYDHHMRDFSDTFNSLDSSKPWKIKLSSAGLIYFYYGREVLREIMMEMNASVPSTKDLELIYDKIYENFVEEIDAIDNGIEQWDGEPRYSITTNLSHRVANINPSWNEQDVDMSDRFHKAMEMIGTEFRDRIRYYYASWLPARGMTKVAVDRRLNVDVSGEIISLESGGFPWKDHLPAIEKEDKVFPLIKYVLFPDTTGSWRVQCVPERPGGFSNRLSLPEPWRGLRDTELSQMSGIQGCVFVHSSGFIGGNKTYEGALQMAQESLKLA